MNDKNSFTINSNIQRECLMCGSSFVLATSQKTVSELTCFDLPKSAIKNICNSCIEMDKSLKKLELTTNELRKKQAENIMPFIGELLDEWDSLPNDIKFLEELDKLRSVLKAIAHYADNLD